jgi:putative transposase
LYSTAGANGKQLKCLTVMDEWTREGLAIEVEGRIRSGRVNEVLGWRADGHFANCISFRHASDKTVL